MACLLEKALLCDISGEANEPASSDRPQLLKATPPTAESSMEPGLMTQHMLPEPGSGGREGGEGVTDYIGTEG